MEREQIEQKIKEKREQEKRIKAMMTGLEKRKSQYRIKLEIVRQEIIQLEAERDALLEEV